MALLSSIFYQIIANEIRRDENRTKVWPTSRADSLLERVGAPFSFSSNLRLRSSISLRYRSINASVSTISFFVAFSYGRNRRDQPPCDCSMRLCALPEPS